MGRDQQQGEFMAGMMFQSKGMRAYGRYGAVGFELIGSIIIGSWIGHWLDGKYDQHWITFVGFLVGCYAGFSSLFRLAKRMTRDIAYDEALARGEDPWAPEQTTDDDDDAPKE